jgi:curved DNA-binding protein CbpA
MSAYKNPFAVLGLTSSATLPEVRFEILCPSQRFLLHPACVRPSPWHPHLSQIKDAYRKLCMQHHPDLYRGPPAQRDAAETYFKEISAAYTKLTRREL